MSTNETKDGVRSVAVCVEVASPCLNIDVVAGVATALDMRDPRRYPWILPYLFHPQEPDSHVFD